MGRAIPRITPHLVHWVPAPQLVPGATVLRPWREICIGGWEIHENHGDPHVSCNQVQTKQTIYYYTIYRRFDRADISDIGKFLRLNYISDPSKRIKGISVEQSRSSRNAALLVLLLVVVFTYSPARPAKRRFIHDWMQILPSLKLKTLPYIALPFTNAYASLGTW